MSLGFCCLLLVVAYQLGAYNIKHPGRLRSKCILLYQWVRLWMQG
jgi:hypothetical protein